MWYTSRQEGFDDPRPTKRGPVMSIGNGYGYLLRTGFTLQFLALTALSIIYWSYGGDGVFGYDLSGTTEEGRLNRDFRNQLAGGTGVYMLGSLYLMLFQTLLSDDTCWARGYRAGSKILRLAVVLDVLSSVMQFMFYLYVAKFYTTKWWGHFNNGGSEWTIYAYTRVLHAMACLLYGLALFLLEVYHDEGAGDLHAYMNACLFGTAGFIELLVLFVSWNSPSSILLWLALASGTLWSYFFEPSVNDASPELYETELTNDVEQQVEKFAKHSPFNAEEQY